MPAVAEVSSRELWRHLARRHLTLSSQSGLGHKLSAKVPNSAGSVTVTPIASPEQFYFCVHVMCSAQPTHGEGAVSQANTRVRSPGALPTCSGRWQNQSWSQFF